MSDVDPLPDDPAETVVYEPVPEIVPGEVVETYPGDPVAPDPLRELVDQLGVEGVTRSAVLGADLAGRAGDLWDALAAIAPANTARPAIEIVTDSALTAAAIEVDVALTQSDPGPP